MPEIILNGITWGHSRGITPLLAISQRFCELNPGIQINWHKRSLQEFADYPIEKLTEQYDLLIIDHPWVGTAAATNCVLPLDEYMDAIYLDKQQINSVGESYLSYHFNGHQWALAIDAATPAASYRPDLFQKNQQKIPSTWEELLALAKLGKVAIPSIPIDCLMNFYSFCIAHGKYPFANKKELVDRETGMKALASMRELYSLLDKKMFHCNPIAVAEIMSSTSDYWYCPFAYCYSNYSRTGYAKNILLYTDVVIYNGKKLRTTIGGTGLAVSLFSKHKEIAVDFAQWIVSGEMQRTLYVQHGGQPGHRSAWIDENANNLANNFFKNTLPVMDNGYVRPRYNGYLRFQDEAGFPLQKCLMENGNAVQTLNEMNKIYQQSLIHKQSIAAV